MAAPAVNAWVRPLVGLLGERDVTSDVTASSEGSGRGATSAAATSVAPPPASTNGEGPAEPPPNPWKVPEAAANSGEGAPVIKLPTKKGKANKGWPSLGDSVAPAKPKAAEAGPGPDKDGERAAPPKAKSGGGRKDKWVPFEEELPLHHRRSEGSGPANGSDRGPKNGRRSRPPGRKKHGSFNGGPTAGAFGGADAAGGAPAAAGAAGAAGAAFWGSELQPGYSGGGPGMAGPGGVPFYPQQPPYPAYGSEYAMMAPPDSATLAFAILQQVEYYLSPQNLPRDAYLREAMDEEGWVPLAHLASFKRLAMLTQHVADIAASLIGSVTLEVRDGMYVRRRGDWHRFVPAAAGEGTSAAEMPKAGRLTETTAFNVAAREFVPGR
mmetsp:Transcript_22213/g.57940  ORF Transcript_22213/g.57940 Transcript_22213/m.57940 type:complete len:381 (+) Transcript_22213:253-1395(+)